MNADHAISQAIAALDNRWGIDALWVFGSQATGASRPSSDLDLAVLFRKRPASNELLDVRGELEQLIGLPVDVIDLDSASPVLVMQVLRFGKLMVDAQPARRISFVAGVPGRYEDLKRIRAPIESALLSRVAHGSR
jgi:predicted nucleotidyltransferase